MKKYFLVLLFCASYSIANAQFFAGIGLNIIAPYQSAITLDAGAGGSANIGYSISNNLDVGIQIDYNRFSAIVEKYSIKDIEIKANYYFFNKSIRPSLGFGAGIFQERFARPLDFPDYYQNALGVQPSIGLLFDNDLLPGLKVNTEFSYTHIFTENTLSTFGFNIGLKYYFKI